MWRDLQPLTIQYDLDDAEDFEHFAADVMCKAVALHNEPEFEDWKFDPADAAVLLTSTFATYVPPPEELEKLPFDEQQDLITEASIQAILHFITPNMQQDLLNTLGRCRRRLKREGQTDKAAMAAATEWLLRSDHRPEIWSTCGIFYHMLWEAIEQATRLDREKEKALKLAQAIQPDVETEYDLVEGTPAYQAFWEAVQANPELSHFMERQAKATVQFSAAESTLDAELALVRPSRIGTVAQ